MAADLPRNRLGLARWITVFTLWIVERLSESMSAFIQIRRFVLPWSPTIHCKVYETR